MSIITYILLTVAFFVACFIGVIALVLHETRLSRLPNVLRQRPEPEFAGRHARLPACL